MSESIQQRFGKHLTWTRFEYLWQDSEKYKKPTKMPAPQYIEHLMAWVQSNVDNEQMFPSKIGMV
jgi:MOB kinase activator 1